MATFTAKGQIMSRDSFWQFYIHKQVSAKVCSFVLLLEITKGIFCIAKHPYSFKIRNRGRKISILHYNVTRSQFDIVKYCEKLKIMKF